MKLFHKITLFLAMASLRFKLLYKNAISLFHWCLLCYLVFFYFKQSFMIALRICLFPTLLNFRYLGPRVMQKYEIREEMIKVFTWNLVNNLKLGQIREEVIKVFFFKHNKYVLFWTILTPWNLVNNLKRGQYFQIKFRWSELETKRLRQWRWLFSSSYE